MQPGGDAVQNAARRRRLGLGLLGAGALMFFSMGSGWAELLRSACLWYGIWLLMLWHFHPKLLFPCFALPKIEEVRRALGFSDLHSPPAGASSHWVNDTRGTSEAWFYLAPPAPGALVVAQDLRDDRLNGQSGTVRQLQGPRVVVDFGSTTGEKALLAQNLRPAGGDDPRPCVVLFHGNGELIDLRCDLARWYQSVARCHVFMPEYRGYGRSQGDPTPALVVKDMHRHLEWLVSRPDVDPARLIFHGVSVGGGVAAAVAQAFRPAALVLQSTFYSLARMGAAYYVPETVANRIVGGLLSTGEALKRIRAHGGSEVQLLLAHGQRDSVVPYSHSEALAREAGVELYSRNCDHNDFPMPMADAAWAAKLGALLSAVAGDGCGAEGRCGAPADGG